MLSSDLENRRIGDLSAVRKLFSAFYLQLTAIIDISVAFFGRPTAPRPPALE
jgi:hypothetical protein